MIEVLKDSGHNNCTGSGRRLPTIKGSDQEDISTAQVLDACDMLISRGILNLKLYFIIGLPTETMTDLDEMVTLVQQVRERVIEAAREKKRLGKVILSINPFIPKPCTPFQWCGMEELKSLAQKVHYLQVRPRPSLQCQH